MFYGIQQALDWRRIAWPVVKTVAPAEAEAYRSGTMRMWPTLWFAGSMLWLAAPILTSAEPASPAGQAAGGATDVCTLLHDDEVRRVFSDARTGERNRRVEKDGAIGCQWRNGKGLVVLHLVLYEGGPHSVEREARGFGTVATDSSKAGAREAIRYESLPSIGDQAVAVVEAGDHTKGVLGNTAFLVAQRGPRLILINAAELAEWDRATALKVLEGLGRAVMNRL